MNICNIVDLQYTNIVDSHYLLTNRFVMLNNKNIELINWKPYLFRSYKGEWEYVVYFNMLWYFAWIGTDLDEWLYDHDTIDISEIMHPFNWIEEDSSKEEVKEALRYFTNISIKRWFISETADITHKMNAATYNEFTAYEEYVESFKEPEKKSSPAPKVAKEENRTYDSLEVFKNLTQIRDVRWVDYRVLKKWIGTRVIEVDSWYVLAEDIVEAYKKDYWI